MGRPTKEQIKERERLAELGLKQCSKKAGCGEIKSVEDFGPNKGTWDNRRLICRICDQENGKRYRDENPELSRASARQYRLNNLEARRQYRREQYAKKRQEDPLYERLLDGKSRAKRAGLEWEDIKSTDLIPHWKQNNISVDTCYYCKQTIDEGDLHLDHGIPIGRGGSHTLDNLFPCHGRCNREKFNKTVEEYLEHLKQVS